MLRKIAFTRNPRVMLGKSLKIPLSTVTDNPWKEQKDPNGSNMTYFWNSSTNEVTPLGSPRPRHWVSVEDKATGGRYWWDPESNETTAINAPKPPLVSVRPNTSVTFPQPMPPSVSASPQSRAPAPQQMPPPFPISSSPAPSFASYFWWGAGLTTAMVAVRTVLGM